MSVSAINDVSQEIVSPLLRRVRSSRAGFVVVLYADDGWQDLSRQVTQQFRDHHLSVVEITLDDAAPNPVARLAQLKQKDTVDVFSIHVEPDTLGKGNDRGHQLVNALNLHRDTFRDRALCAVFWIAESHARAFYDEAANFLDYRTRIVELAPSTPVPHRETAGPPTVHNLPFSPLGDAFQGRDDAVQQLAESLQTRGLAAICQPISIQGLGGVGKTRLAVEYAWRRRADYSHILFVRADSPAALQANLAGLTTVLDLPEREATDEAVRYEAVLNWLEEHASWLLILDNADDELAAEAVHALLDRLAHGAVIVTSRYRRWGGEMARLDVGVLPCDAAVRFLLAETDGYRRETQEDTSNAEEIAEALDYLPLALEQAAAYIRCRQQTLRDYLTAWRENSRDILSWYDDSVMRYPRPIAATWSTSVACLSEPAQVILRVLAWLAPDPVPLDLLQANRDAYSDVLPLQEDTLTESQIDEAVKELCSLSLLENLSADTVAMHRVFQEVQRTRAGAAEREASIQVALQIVNGYVPFDTDDVRQWPKVEAVRPHAMQVLRAAEEYGIATPATVFLLNQMGLFFLAKALFAQAEPLIRRALTIDEQSGSADHASVAILLNNLAQLLKATNRLAEAEPLMRQALAIDEKTYGADDPGVAIDLNNLAQLLKATNRLAEAEPLMRQALAIDEKTYGADHPSVAIRLNNLALLLQDTDRLTEAEPLMRRALTIGEQTCDPDHPNIAIRLNNLAQLLQDTNRLAEAEPLMRQALAIDEQSYGAEHPCVARDLNNLAQLLQATNRLAEAEPLMRRALSIDEQSYGADHPDVAIDLNNLSQLLRATGRLAEAEPLVRRALAILRDSLGDDHPRTQTADRNYAALAEALGVSESEIEAAQRTK